MLSPITFSSILPRVGKTHPRKVDTGLPLQSPAEPMVRFGGSLFPYRFEGGIRQDILPEKPTIRRVRTPKTQAQITQELRAFLKGCEAGDFFLKIKKHPKSFLSDNLYLKQSIAGPYLHIRLSYEPTPYRDRVGGMLKLYLGPDYDASAQLNIKLNNAWAVTAISAEKDPYHLWGAILNYDGKTGLAEKVGATSVETPWSKTRKELSKAYSTQRYPIEYLPEVSSQSVLEIVCALNTYRDGERKLFFKSGSLKFIVPNVMLQVLAKDKIGANYRGLDEEQAQSPAGLFDYLAEEIYIAVKYPEIESTVHHELGHWFDHYLGRQLQGHFKAELSESVAFKEKVLLDLKAQCPENKIKLLSTILGFSEAKAQEILQLIDAGETENTLVLHFMSELLADIHSALKCCMKSKDQAWLLDKMKQTATYYHTTYREVLKEHASLYF